LEKELLPLVCVQMHMECLRGKTQEKKKHPKDENREKDKQSNGGRSREKAKKGGKQKEKGSKK
jgi:hypothetical protein